MPAPSPNHLPLRVFCLVQLLNRERLSKQLIPYKEVKQSLRQVGAPVEPEQIGITRKRLRETFVRAQFIRRRFTVLDLAVRTGYMEQWLDGLFGKGKIWEITD